MTGPVQDIGPGPDSAVEYAQFPVKRIDFPLTKSPFLKNGKSLPAGKSWLFKQAFQWKERGIKG